MSEATRYSHTQARLDIEMDLDGLLSPGQQEILHTHLLTCVECRAYYEEFISLEKTLGEIFKASLPEVEYSRAETQQFSREVKARYARRPHFNSLQWANSLAWVGAVALMMVGLAWILSNTRLENIPPIESPPSVALSLETPPGIRLTLPGNGQPVNQVAYSTDDRLLAAATDNGQVILWQVADGAQWLTINTGQPGVSSVIFSGGVHLLVLGKENGVLQVWQVSTGQLLQTISNIPGKPHLMGLSATGEIQFLRQPNEFIINTAPSVKVPWATRRGIALTPIILPGLAGEVVTASVSPDGNILATGSKSGVIHFWQITVKNGKREGTLLFALQGHTGPITNLAFQPDGQYLASASEDGTLRVWRVTDGVALYTLTEQTSSIQSIAFSPNGSSLAAALKDGTVYLWMAEEK